MDSSLGGVVRFHAVGTNWDEHRHICGTRDGTQRYAGEQATNLTGSFYEWVGAFCVSDGRVKLAWADISPTVRNDQIHIFICWLDRPGGACQICSF